MRTRSGPRKTTLPPGQTRFGQLLRQQRERLGLTLREMEDRGPFTYSHLCRIERGARNPPDREDVIALATAAEMDADELLVAAGYLPVTAPQPAIIALPRGTRFAPTEAERRLIEEANTCRVYAAFLSEAAFWEQPADERRTALRYLDGLLDENRRISKLQTTR